ncbi:hypothetical protein CVT25_002739 [Psilocybe cyanescens]|uniref:Uncharacterized protein n=1 Tax=Psilocybe cyanescens TaxID=93625 RepID=A0A409WL65_PSICY|nr:hypothetical protein CVT25_002739 [Psilocybe cyanescens]
MGMNKIGKWGRGATAERAVLDSSSLIALISLRGLPSPDIEQFPASQSWYDEGKYIKMTRIFVGELKQPSPPIYPLGIAQKRDNEVQGEILLNMGLVVDIGDSVPTRVV